MGLAAEEQEQEQEYIRVPKKRFERIEELVNDMFQELLEMKESRRNRSTTSRQTDAPS